jgi:hypothetical protein
LNKFAKYHLVGKSIAFNFKSTHLPAFQLATGLGFHLIHAALVNAYLCVNNQTTFSGRKSSLSYMVLRGIV